mmetsp:Transcript_69232/g.180341  ORF Transcript_69232/g.180341 Transcript_69232/m.180341 type:complete len:209 (+) Transcript_69232:994-1620(+)
MGWADGQQPLPRDVLRRVRALVPRQGRRRAPPQELHGGHRPVARLHMFGLLHHRRHPCPRVHRADDAQRCPGGRQRTLLRHPVDRGVPHRLHRGFHGVLLRVGLRPGGDPRLLLLPGGEDHVRDVLVRQHQLHHPGPAIGQRREPGLPDLCCRWRQRRRAGGLGHGQFREAPRRAHHRCVRRLHLRRHRHRRDLQRGEDDPQPLGGDA